MSPVLTKSTKNNKMSEELKKLVALKSQTFKKTTSICEDYITQFLAERGEKLMQGNLFPIRCFLLIEHCIS